MNQEVNRQGWRSHSKILCMFWISLSEWFLNLKYSLKLRQHQEPWSWAQEGASEFPTWDNSASPVPLLCQKLENKVHVFTNTAPDTTRTLKKCAHLGHVWRSENNSVELKGSRDQVYIIRLTQPSALPASSLQPTPITAGELRSFRI